MSEKFNQFRRYKDGRYNLARNDMYRQLYFFIADTSYVYNDFGMLALMVKPPYKPNPLETPYEIISHLVENNLLVLGTAERITDDLLSYLSDCHENDRKCLIELELWKLRKQVNKLERMLTESA